MESTFLALLLAGVTAAPVALYGSSQGQQPEVWNEREDTFENLDANRSGRIERSEWRATADAFQWLDRNNDGALSRAEFVGNTNRRDATQRSRDRRDPAARGTAGRTDCTTSAPQVVDDVYQQVLERPADQASAQLTQALASGRMTVRDVVREVAKSPEHAERFFWQPAVQNLYHRLLGRDADPEGLQVFIERARTSGLSAAERDIMASPEYQQKGRGAARAGDDAAAYDAAVRSLYHHILGRDPDAVGLRDLTQVAMASGFNAVIDRMLSSSEYQRLVGDNGVPGRSTTYCGTTR